MKAQRMRDPVHDLILFSGEGFEGLIWSLINTKEFQRLRRIRQLGFSELVYPGATHTRFSHSVGVFHTARCLVELLKRLLGPNSFDGTRADVAVCAALLHDLGHGPFSHTFEGVLAARGMKKKHEKWSAEIIRGNTEVHEVLFRYDRFLPEAVADLLEQEQPTDIYSSVVSSQFDADRLDYLRRDKLMTGTEQGGFDWAWLLNNLEVERLTIGGDGDIDPFEVDGFIINSKGLQAAEGYLLGRFHLYTQVYLHKTTRSSEKMLGCLLNLAAACIERAEVGATGLPEGHPLVTFIENGCDRLDDYLHLDDAVVASSLGTLSSAADPQIAELATRIRRRDLFKCFDVGAMADLAGGNARVVFRRLLNDAKKNGDFGHEVDVLEDSTAVSPYKLHEFESKSALEKILVRRPGGGRPEDIARLSRVVEALGERKIFRIYTRDQSVAERIQGPWKRVI
jgi:HD superfamily phosphohydrolase